jgi:carbon-monoxide dehydrogenase medium subunit
MKPSTFEYVRPETTQAAVTCLTAASTDGKLIGGGQSLGPMLNLRLARPDFLVDVSRLADLRRCSRTAEYVEIGSAVTHAEIEDGQTPEPIDGMLRHVAAGIAYRAVRNRGTIGGSLCHADPAADWLSAMTVLDASMIIAGASGETREVAMTDFMSGAYRTCLDVDEVATAVRIPVYSKKACWGYHKICRKVGEFADAIGAFVADPEKRYCRVLAGATGGPPVILDKLALELGRTASPPDRSRIEEELRASGIVVNDIKSHQLAVAVHRSIARVLRNE